MTFDEFTKQLGEINSEISAFNRKIQPRLKAYNEVATRIGEPRFTIPWDKTPDFAWDKLSDEEKLSVRRKVADEMKMMDLTIDSQLEAIRLHKANKRSVEASHQKRTGHENEVALCNILITCPNISKVSLYHTRRPENVDPRVKCVPAAKADVSFTLANGLEHIVSVKAPKDGKAVQWALHATDEVRAYWGKDHPLFKLCEAREKYEEAHVKELLDFAIPKLPPDVATEVKSDYEGGKEDHKVIKKKIRKYCKIAFDEFEELQRIKYGVDKAVNDVNVWMNDRTNMEKYLRKYLTNDGETKTFILKADDGNYYAYNFEDYILFLLMNGTSIRKKNRAESSSIDIGGEHPSITIEFRTKGKFSLLIRQGWRGVKPTTACVLHLVKKLTPLFVVQFDKDKNTWELKQGVTSPT